MKINRNDGLTSTSKTYKITVGKMSKHQVIDLVNKLSAKVRLVTPDKYVFDINGIKTELKSQTVDSIMERNNDYISELLKRNLIHRNELIKNKLMLNGVLSFEGLIMGTLVAATFLVAFIGSLITPQIKNINQSVKNVSDKVYSSNDIGIDVFGDKELRIQFEGGYNEKNQVFLKSIYEKAKFLSDVSHGERVNDTSSLSINLANINDSLGTFTINNELYNLFNTGYKISNMLNIDASVFNAQNFYSAHREYIEESSQGFSSNMPNYDSVKPRWNDIDESIKLKEFPDGTKTVQRLNSNVKFSFDSIIHGYLVEYVRRTAVEDGVKINAWIDGSAYSITAPELNHSVKILDPRCIDECEAIGELSSFKSQPFSAVIVNDKIRNYDNNGHRWSEYDAVDITRTGSAISQLVLYSEDNVSYLQALATQLFSINDVTRTTINTTLKTIEDTYGHKIDYVYSLSDRTSTSVTSHIGIRIGGSRYESK